MNHRLTFADRARDVRDGTLEFLGDRLDSLIGAVIGGLLLFSVGLLVTIESKVNDLAVQVDRIAQAQATAGGLDEESGNPLGLHQSGNQRSGPGVFAPAPADRAGEGFYLPGLDVPDAGQAQGQQSAAGIVIDPVHFRDVSVYDRLEASPPAIPPVPQF